MKTRDIDIRNSLNNYIINKFNYDSTTRIINELNVCYGSARVDIAAINGSFYGYEIKSDIDTLDRLPQQAEYYSKVFDYVNLVCSEKFLEKAVSIIPDWWGLYIASSDVDSSINIINYRNCSQNESIDPFSLTQFLWKEEVLNYLTKIGAEKKLNRLPKYKLWLMLAELSPIEDLKLYVRTCLKQRDNRIPV